jgi:DNA-binding response OmpR family regulator
MKETILLVEDNPQIMTINRKALRAEGFNVIEAENATKARALIRITRPDLIILDVVLPDGNGYELCEEIRETLNIPVLFVTTRGGANDIITGFDAGGDDYLPKPYEPEVMVMRVKALLRRTQAVPDVLTYGPFQINIPAAKAYFNGDDIGLQQKELHIFMLFVQSPSGIIPPEVLYEKVWGQKMLGQDNALKVAVSKLRAKLQGTGYTISASRREGYYLEIE